MHLRAERGGLPGVRQPRHDAVGAVLRRRPDAALVQLTRHVRFWPAALVGRPLWLTTFSPPPPLFIWALSIYICMLYLTVSSLSPTNYLPSLCILFACPLCPPASPPPFLTAESPATRRTRSQQNRLNAQSKQTHAHTTQSSTHMSFCSPPSPFPLPSVEYGFHGWRGDVSTARTHDTSTHRQILFNTLKPGSFSHRSVTRHFLEHTKVAVGEAFCRPTPLPSAGVSIETERGRQQNNGPLADGDVAYNHVGQRGLHQPRRHYPHLVWRAAPPRYNRKAPAAAHSTAPSFTCGRFVDRDWEGAPAK